MAHLQMLPRTIAQLLIVLLTVMLTVLLTVYSLSIHCVFTVYTVHSPPIHCLFTAYSLSIHFLCRTVNSCCSLRPSRAN
jgi:hypothetical protein